MERLHVPRNNGAYTRCQLVSFIGQVCATSTQTQQHLSMEDETAECYLPSQYGVASDLVLRDCPIEILLLIFSALLPDSKSILRCREVCHLFKDSIDASVTLQLEIRLQVWGYERFDSKGSELSAFSDADLLKHLELHVKKWDNLDWEKTEVDTSTGRAYDLAHGYFATATAPSSLRVVTVVELPRQNILWRSTDVSGEISMNPARVYDLPPVPFEIKDLAIDPSQDLIVIVET